jgi:hypothetical protein
MTTMRFTKPTRKSTRNSRPPTRRSVEQRTYSTVESAVTSGEDTIVQYPPTVPPEEYAPEIIESNNLAATYLVPTNKVGELVKERCENLGLSTRLIRSDKSKCGTYSEEHGKPDAERVKRLLRRQPVSLTGLHSEGMLPCQSGSPCPYTTTNPEYTEDVLIGHPVIAYADAVRENRTIFAQYLKADEFRTEIKNPERELAPYIDSLDIGCSSYVDLLKRRDSGSLDIDLSSYIQDSQRAKDPLRPGELDTKGALNGGGHVLAPLAVFGLIYSERLDNELETTHYYRELSSDTRLPTKRYQGSADRWELAGLDYDRHRVVRIPNEDDSDTLHVLRCPDFSVSNGVVALDTVPVRRMWNTNYGLTFDLERVLPEQDTREFLRDTMNVSVIHVADKPRPYDGGQVRPGRDASIAQWIDAEHGEKPILMTTGHALENGYTSRKPFPTADTSTTVQYRDYETPITDPSPVIFASGTARPPNEEFQVWGAFQGESIPGQPNNNSFGTVGDRIRYQLRDAYVGRSVARFTESGATLVLNTTARPDWLQSPRDTKIDPTNILSGKANAKRRVLRYLRRRGDNPPTIDGIVDTAGADVSQTTAENAVRLFEGQGWVTKHNTGSKEYSYEWIA